MRSREKNIYDMNEMQDGMWDKDMGSDFYYKKIQMTEGISQKYDKGRKRHAISCEKWTVEPN